MAKTLPLKSIARDLVLGPLEDRDHDLGVAGVSPLDELDLGELVAFLLVEPLDLPDREWVRVASARLPLLQAGGLLDVLELDLVLPRNSTFVRWASP